MLPFIKPDWPVPASVKALTTTRMGGVSKGAWNSLNLGEHCGDATRDVAENRRRLECILAAPPKWLNQVHGHAVLVHDGFAQRLQTADGITSSVPGQVCAVLTADCLPVLFADSGGMEVAAAHAGWRGLSGGILENTLQAMNSEPGQVLAWLGPAIGPARYEVGDEVRDVFLAADAGLTTAFRRSGDRWLADLYSIARHRLRKAGVEKVFGGDFCTVSDSARFYSYRRDGITGRMATVIWLDPHGAGARD